MAFDASALDSAAFDVLPIAVQNAVFRDGGCSFTVLKHPVTQEIMQVTWVNPAAMGGKITLRAQGKTDFVATVSGTAGSVNVPAGFPWSDTSATEMNVAVVY